VFSDNHARVVLGVIDVWGQRNDARNVTADRGRRKRDNAKPAVPREVAATADSADDAAPPDVSRVDVAVEVDFDGAVHPDNTESVDQLGRVRDICRSQHHVLGVVLDIVKKALLSLGR
jgi:hypothetical protein